MAIFTAIMSFLSLSWVGQGISMFWNWLAGNSAAQTTQNNSVEAAEQQHENDGTGIVALGNSISAQEAALKAEQQPPVPPATTSKG